MPESTPIADLLLARGGQTRSAHLLGICGAGMKAWAEFLRDRGWNVTGCDQEPDSYSAARLRSMGIDVATGHADTHLRPELDLVIHSPAIPADQPELLRARELGIPVRSSVEVLGELSRKTRLIAVCGTHGKSTTTAWLAEILRLSNRSPNVICGAESVSSGRNGLAGEGNWLVAEACEYRRHFHQLSPSIVCLTGIEQDHFDTYPTLESAVDAYRQLIAKLPADGLLIYNRDCPRSTVLGEEARCRSIPFSLDDSDVAWHPEFFPLSLEGPERHPGSMLAAGGQESQFCAQLRLWGMHNIRNALGAATVARAAGCSSEDIVRGLESFSGLKRRLEIVRDDERMTVVDDYAHHPTEVAAAIAAVRDAFPDRPVWCVFQPHQLSRTRQLFAEFATVLRGADRVWLLPVYAARESASEECTSLSRELASHVGPAAQVIPSLDRVWETVQTDSTSQPVLLTLGAGSISRLHHEPD